MDRFLDFFFDHIGDLLLIIAALWVLALGIVLDKIADLREQDDEEEK